MKNQFKVLSGVLALALTGQVFAATNWLTATNSPGSITLGTSTATPTAWAGGAGETLVQQLGGATNSTTNFVAYGSLGLGINNSLEPEAVGVAPDHAIDNNVKNEMVLLTFDKAVNLTSLAIGWANGGDADYTVMAYTGSGAPSLGSATGNNKTWDALKVASSGWTLIGDYQNTSTSAVQTKDSNNNATSYFNDKAFANSYYSSYWLIGAYNPLVGIMAGFTADATADYFKLASVAGTVCSGTASAGKCVTSKVPEPGSLALVGLGLLGVIRMRKARKA